MNFISQVKAWLETQGVKVAHDIETLTAEEYDHVKGILCNRFGVDPHHISDALVHPSILPTAALDAINGVDPSVAQADREEAQAAALREAEEKAEADKLAAELAEGDTDEPGDENTGADETSGDDSASDGEEEAVEADSANDTSVKE